jgi:hypothetical protein
MTERRTQPRLTSSELVLVSWSEESAKLNQPGTVQNLSLDGMGILVHEFLPVGIPVTVSYGYGELNGTVRHSSQLIDATFIGIEFDEITKNSILHLKPELLIREP